MADHSSMRARLLEQGRSLLVRCVPTADNVRGPFYRSNAPFRERLCPIDEPGEPLMVHGIVSGLPTCDPLAGAVLDVWQTNARGFYSNMLGFGNPAKPKAYHLRGRIRTAADGRYRFFSVVPGHYPLWPFTRARHIHVIVTHDRYSTFVTQVFFEGDEYRRWDPWVKDSLVVELSTPRLTSDGRRQRAAQFDIVLPERRADPC
jgi:catechol 1,2-dioxygenase